MIDLNNVEEIKKLDPKDVAGSTGMLASQCEQIWQDSKALQFSSDYSTIKNIVICGMGGSAYGGHVAFSLFKEELRVPLYINSDYSLPGFVNKDTLVILTSYSGSTEESHACGEAAVTKGAKLAGLTSGGKLAELLKKQNAPMFVFDTKFNPSTQPRLGTGYIVLGTIAFLHQMKFLQVTDALVLDAINQLKILHDEIKTLATDIAKQLVNFMPLIIAAEFLEGNAHIMRNQFNETSKSFSAFSPVPELNHHLMEGLKNPADNTIKTLLITSLLYDTRVQKRMTLTKEVIEKNNVQVIEIKALGENKLTQVLTTLSLGGYITLYLALLYGLDPSLIPWVDYFKEQLAK